MKNALKNRQAVVKAPFAFQTKSVARIVGMLENQGAAMLGHDPGLGKTIIAIRVANAMRLKRILVVTTVSSLFNWQREFKQWGTTDRTVGVITSTKLDVQDVEGYDVIVMAYSQLSGVTRTLEAVTAQSYDLVILDEAHALKTMGTKRTNAAYFGVDAKDGMAIDSLIDCAAYTLAMSGTFTSNHYGELYSHLEAMVPDALRDKGLRDYDTFLNHFCVVKQGNYGPVVLGNRNVPELRELLKPVYHRFSRKRVLKDLPALVIEDKVLPMTADALVAEARLEEAMGNAGFNTEPEEFLAAEVPLSTERRELGLAKVPAVVRFVLDELEHSDEKMILFAHHRDVLTLLVQQLKRFSPVMVRGGLEAKYIDASIQRFQTDPDCRLFLGQIDSAGEAITLTAATRVAFAEFSWDPGKNYQAILRAHRIGQDQSVLAQFLVMQGSLDEAMGRVVARKTKMIMDLLN